MTQIQDFLRQCVDARRLLSVAAPPQLNGYVGLDDFVLQHGRYWTPAPKPRRIPFGPLKNCYQNASEASLRHRLIYCEGYACGPIPVLHAWCVDDRGRVVDPTWRKRGTEYFGIAFDRKYVLRALLTNGHYGLIDAWAQRWPLLRDDPQEWKHPIMSVNQQKKGQNEQTDHVNLHH